MPSAAHSRTLALAFALLTSPAAAQPPTPTLSPSRELAERFLAADRNADGALSRQEVSSAGWISQQQQTFDGLDTDRSGTVTLAEITTAVARKVERWMGADTDRDGRISAAEARADPELAAYSRTKGSADAMTTQELQRFGESSYYQAGDLPSVAPNLFEKRF